MKSIYDSHELVLTMHFAITCIHIIYVYIYIYIYKSDLTNNYHQTSHIVYLLSRNTEVLILGVVGVMLCDDFDATVYLQLKQI